MSYLWGLDYLAYKLWPWLLAAFVLGALWGWFSCQRNPDRGDF